MDESKDLLDAVHKLTGMISALNATGQSLLKEMKKKQLPLTSAVEVDTSTPEGRRAFYEAKAMAAGRVEAPSQERPKDRYDIANEEFEQRWIEHEKTVEADRVAREQARLAATR